VKNGNDTDREKLGEASIRNNNVRPNKTQNRKIAERPLYPSRQRRRIEKQQQDRTPNVDDNAFMEAFRDVQVPDMTPEQEQRDWQLNQQVDCEIQEERRATEANRQAHGDGVARDGSLLFVHHSTGFRPNYGDSSNIGRQQYAAQVLDSALGAEPAATPARRKKPPQQTTARRKKPPQQTTARQKKPPQTARQKKPTPRTAEPTTNELPTSTTKPTTCAIKGCTFGTALKADHKCYNKCGRVVHNLCAQANNLCDEDNELDMYCSIECKRSKK
jgi:hypothetical protein